MSLVIGCDPDSAGFPVSKYRDGKLEALEVLSVVQFVDIFRNEITRPDLLVIEDVQANKGIYARNDVGGRRVAQQIAQRVGMCKQMQTVAVSIAEHYDVPVIAVRPTKANWADDKARFEAATGWTGRSNKDTRSAAYFGWLHRHHRSSDK